MPGAPAVGPPGAIIAADVRRITPNAEQKMKIAEAKVSLATSPALREGDKLKSGLDPAGLGS